MKKYKHIIFDIDGTLLDTEQALLQSLKDTVSETLHKDVPKSELRFALGIPGEVTLRKLGIEDVESASALWNRYLLKYKSSIRLFDGIQPLLALLKADGYTLGIVTSKTRKEYMTDFAGSFGITDYFSTVICVEDTPCPKPAPAPLLAYLVASNIHAQDALYVGDTAYDSQCARHAGVDFGLAIWGNASAQGIPADYLFNQPQAVSLRLTDSCKNRK